MCTNTDKLCRQLLAFRGESEKNDLVDAYVHVLRLIAAMSSANYEEKEDRYEGLDGRSKKFWKNHFKEGDEGGQFNPKHFFGF